MLLDHEAVPFVRVHDRAFERPLEPGGGGEILDPSAFLADEVVVVAGEVLGELEAREPVAGDDPVQHARGLQHHEVAVGAALCQTRTLVEDLGRGERSGCRHEDRNQLGAAVREALIHAAETHLGRGACVAALVAPSRGRASVSSAPVRRGCAFSGSGVIGRAHPQHRTTRPARVPRLPMRVTWSAGTFVAVDPRDRFVALFDASPVSLFDGALCIAECAALNDAHPASDGAAREFDRDRVDQAIERLAAGVHVPTLAGVIEHLCVSEGFAGNTQRYDDPRNSLVDHVLARRRGIPIALCTIAIEVGRRAGADLAPIAMPGHFLIGDGSSFGDVFHAQVLDEAGCATLHARLFGARRGLAPADLEPTPGPAVFARMLNNLEAGPLGRDLDSLGWMLDLHRSIPDLPPAERVALANRLELLGRFDQAASQLEQACEHLAEELVAPVRARAAACHNRRN